MKQKPLPLKRIIMLFFAFFIVSSIMAQKINLAELNSDQLNLYKEKAVKMRNAGMALTLVGIPAYITGALLLLNYMETAPIEDWNSFEPNFYAVLTLGGAASGIAGIPLWIIGGSRKTKAEVALKAFDMKTEDSIAVGLGITLRF
jgi:hypothetical protein